MGSLRIVRDRTNQHFLYKAWVAVFLLACTLSACRGNTLAETGVLVVGIENNPTNLDPRLATDAASSRIAQLVYNGLFRKDTSDRLVPDLVESWKQEDAVTYLFQLKRGVQFHDGSSLDAEDVVFTFLSVMNPVTGSPHRGSFAMVDSIDAPDPYTVRFRLKEQFASFLTALDMGILPSGETGSIHPIGSGPFRFVSWNPGESIMLDANATYHEGVPRLKGIQFKIIPDNTVRIMELRKGSVHLIQNEIEPDMLRDIEKDRRFQIMKREGTSYSYMGFNLRDPILQSIMVRKAIAYAIDRQAIIDHLLGGLAIPATGVLSPMNWAYEGDVQTFAYDPEKARQLLDEAGYPDPDGDGPAVRFELNYKTSQNEIRRRIGEAIQGQLDKVGIKVRMRSYEWGTFFSDIKNGNFQIYTLTWVGVTDPDIFYYLFYSKSIPPSGANRGHYINDEVDQLILSGRVTQDMTVRKEIYGKIQKILAEDLPYVSLWYSLNIAVMDSHVKGFELYPSGDLISLKDVWIE